jgi:tetratricopeptide (TPR) repeat protein
MSENTPERLKQFRAEYSGGARPGNRWAAVNTVILVVGLGAIIALLVSSGGGADAPAGMTAPGGGLSADALREHAGNLAEKKLPKAAVAAYKEYLDHAVLDASARAKICYSVGKLAIEAEEYEEALTFLYQAEMLDPASSVKDDLDKKIVLCLDKLGRSVDLRRELRKRTAVTRTAADVEAGEKVLAEFAGQVVTDRDLAVEIEKLPASVRETVDSPEKKAELLKNLVAERLLLDKAFRIELDKEPAIQEKLTATRDGLIVRELINREVQSKININAADVERFYKAETERFTEPATRTGIVGEGASAEAAQTNLAEASKPGNKTAQRVVLRGGQLVRGLGLEGSDEAVAKALTDTAPAPIQIGEKWFVFAVSETPAKVHPFEAVKDQAERMLHMQKEREQFQVLIEETLKARNVKLHLDRLNDKEAAPQQ